MKRLRVILLIGFLLSPFVVGAKKCYINKDTQEKQSYNTIQEAILYRCQEILVGAGRYSENIIIPNGVMISGIKEKTIIEGNVQMNGLSRLQNISIDNSKKQKLKQAVVGLRINNNADVTVENVIVTYSDIGIEVMGDGKLTIVNSEVANNRKGFYIRQGGIINIVNNKIIDNKEEGIDIRAKVSGKINNNEIINSGESGVEVIVGGTNLEIVDNIIKTNYASGITLQFYKDHPELGKFLVGGNKFIGNDRYAISCQRPSGGRTAKEYWDRSVTFNYNMTNSNKEGEIDSGCKFNSLKKWEMYRTKKAQEILNQTLREIKKFYGGISEKEIVAVINDRMGDDSELNQPDDWWKQVIEGKEKETADGIVKDLENQYKELQGKDAEVLRKASRFKIIFFGADQSTKQELKNNLEECSSFVRKTQRRIGRMGVGYIKTDTLKRIKKNEQCHKLQTIYKQYGENQGLIFWARKIFQR